MLLKKSVKIWGFKGLLGESESRDIGKFERTPRSLEFFFQTFDSLTPFPTFGLPDFFQASDQH
jgi:hypothetical protein